jgi:ferric-dicitrate binding protein FerR (iron transport regulator)
MESDVLLRYLSDRSPVDERSAVEAWLSADEANRVELARLDRAWRLAASWRQPAFDVDGIWTRIRPQLDGSPAAEIATARPRPARRSASLMPPSTRSRWARRAARGVGALAVVAVAVLFIRKGGPSSPTTREPAMHAYVTRAGERAELQLTDGSKVVLNGATTLRIPEGFGKGVRDVYLDGGAYFEVTHDSARMFRVHTSRMTAEDLGTRFTIMAYAADSSEHVAVAEGRVGVEGKDSAEAVVLAPNDVAHISEAGVVSATRGVAVDRYFGWVDGVVQFDEDAMSDAARSLERRFGVEIRVTDSALAARRISGSVRAATLYDDLRGLALMLDLKYERDGRVVTLGSRRRSAR